MRCLGRRLKVFRFALQTSWMWNHITPSFWTLCLQIATQNLIHECSKHWLQAVCNVWWDMFSAFHPVISVILYVEGPAFDKNICSKFIDKICMFYSSSGCDVHCGPVGCLTHTFPLWNVIWYTLLNCLLGQSDQSLFSSPVYISSVWYHFLRQ